jgi:hypothetical protein
VGGQPAGGSTDESLTERLSQFRVEFHALSLEAVDPVKPWLLVHVSSAARTGLGSREDDVRRTSGADPHENIAEVWAEMFGNLEAQGDIDLCEAAEP